MHVQQVRLVNFKRFHDLNLVDIPLTAKLVVLTGPNGSGKSAIFEGMNWWRRTHGGWGQPSDDGYFSKAGPIGVATGGPSITVQFHEPPPATLDEQRKAFWIRSAYRHESDFSSMALQRQPPLLEEAGVNRLIDADQSVRRNYERLTTTVLQALFDPANDAKSVAGLRDEYIGKIQVAMKKVFGDLTLRSPGDPLTEGSFYFDKGAAEHFHFKNLSAGERSAFDLLLDFVLRMATFDNTVYCIDEPELHTGTRTQAALLHALFELLPGNCQLWVATHSIGMMRAALDLHRTHPGAVAFLDTAGLDFDTPVELRPITPDRDFWRRSLEVALDDLSDLVAPDRVVLCEGQKPTFGFDSACYRIIFGSEFPGTEFVSVGNSFEVKSDALGLAKAVQVLAPGTQVVRLVDGDDHSDDERAILREQGVRVLSRRSIESYLLDDEILGHFCRAEGDETKLPDLLAAKAAAIESAVGRGKPSNDAKAIRGDVQVAARKLFDLQGRGNTAEEFLRTTLAPLISSETSTYESLRQEIFG